MDVPATQVQQAVQRQVCTWMQWLCAASRLLAPFRVVHSSGVFDVAGCADMTKEGWRVGSQLHFQDASDPQSSWRPWLYKYALCTPGRAPKHFAPHQPRFDHQIHYQGIGLRGAEFNWLSPWLPGQQCTWLHRWAA